MRKALTLLRAVIMMSPTEAVKMCLLIWQVRNYTMVSLKPLILLYKLGKQIDKANIDGDIVQCGCWNGGAGALMAKASGKSREVWLLDSFTGMPEPTKEDETGKYNPWSCYKDPYFIASVEKVAEVCKHTGIHNRRVHIVQGWFKDTFPKMPKRAVCLLHIDCDWYESVKLSLETFYDAVSSGGYIIVDDYGMYGSAMAVDEFIKNRRLEVNLIKIEQKGCFFRKGDG